MTFGLRHCGWASGSRFTREGRPARFDLDLDARRWIFNILKNPSTPLIIASANSSPAINKILAVVDMVYSPDK